jgi:Glycosyl hydrolases family 35/Beta-galactosidase, domain 2/Beta-galactosidase second all-beta domain
MLVSRRRFVANVLAIPAAAAFFPWRLWGVSGSSGLYDTRLFPKPDVIRYDSECYTIRGVDTFIFSLECPYPRCAREEWRDRFVKIKQAGFNTIDTYVFWNYHEREEGRFDFSELEEFLTRAAEFGFFVIVRPGPYVDAEFERGGFPAYVIAQRFPVRSMHPDSLRTSKHWYDNVLPVIRRHQITEGGPIILMQIENEIDFTDVPEVEQREYIRFLARLAWDAGIQVPLISNVSSVVRDRSDPDMARIIDVCDFYPRWSFLTDNELPKNTTGLTMEEKVSLSDRAVLASLRKMRKDEPNAPLSVAELGTGYYSKIGGKLSEDEEGADSTQINALTKTIIEHGVTYINYYLGWGGSNHDWAAKGVTSTYDFAAPIREWGGLWDKYYNVKAIGDFLHMFGEALTRSRVMEQAARSTHSDMTVSERASGNSAFVFVRADTDAEHHFKLTFRDPVDGSSVTVPQHGQLTMGPHAMKILPVQVPIAGAHLCYSTAEVLAYGSCGDRSVLLVYDAPGSLAELSVKSKQRPTIAGDAVYTTWDEANQSASIGFLVGNRESYFLLNESLIIAVLPRQLALHTWVGKFKTGKTEDRQDIPFITDAYLLASTGSDATGVWADLDYLPGDHALTVILPAEPAQCLIDAKEKSFHYDQHRHAATLTHTVPASPAKPVEIPQVSTWVEPLDTKSGKWVRSSGRVLENIGPVPFGYVKYRAHIGFKDEPRAYLQSFTNNDKKVFINGKLIPGASKPDRFLEFPTKGYFQPGENTVEISYELFGSTEFGETARMAELNGIESIRLGTNPDQSTMVNTWDIQTFPAPTNGRQLDPAFVFSGKKAVTPGTSSTGMELVPAFTWCEAEFTLPDAGQGWSIPWKVTFEADRDALFYLNGTFIGRYVVVGPQTSFYISESLLRTKGQSNTLTIVLAYADTADSIKTLRVEPYEDHAVRRTRVEFRW